MAQGPGALGVQPFLEVRVGLVQNLVRAESVETQESVRLIETVFAQQGRCGVQGRQGGAVISATSRGVKEARGTSLLRRLMQ